MQGSTSLFKRMAVAGSAFFGLSFSGTPGQAQSLITRDLPLPTESLPFETVLSRARPGYDAVGYQAGPWQLNAAMDVRLAYDSNPTAAVTSSQSDGLVELAPRAQAKADWGGSGLDLQVDSAFGVFFKSSEQDYKNVSASARGFLQLQPGSQVNAEFSYDRTKQARDNPDDVQESRSPVFSVPEAVLGFSHTQGQLRGFVEGRYGWFRVGDSRLANGVLRTNNDRDRNILGIAGEVSYGPNDIQRFYVNLDAARHDYRLAIDRSGFNRDGWIVQALGGVRTALGPLVHVDAAAGIARYDFSASTLQSGSKLAFRGSVTWSATPLLTVNANTRRWILPTSIVQGRFLTRTDYGVGIDYELLRNVLLHGEGGVSERRYEGIPRKDRVYRAELSARYLINQRIGVQAGYSYRQRSVKNDTSGDRDFDRHRLFVGVTWQL